MLAFRLASNLLIVLMSLIETKYHAGDPMSIDMDRRKHAKNFGKKLRHLRMGSGLTLKELAQALGYSAHGHISELEAGKKTPTVEFVVKVADLFEVSTDELIRDEFEFGGQRRRQDTKEES